MKIKHKLGKEDEKAGCCNNYASDLYQLDGWAKDDWLCAFCFVEELRTSEARYQVIPKRELK